jgi:Na+-driven multidrug efflux pump
VLVGVVGGTAGVALTALERGGPVAAISMGTALLCFACVWWLIGDHGLVGAAFGMLIAELVGCAARWTTLLAIERSNRITAGKT